MNFVLDLISRVLKSDDQVPFGALILLGIALVVVEQAGASEPVLYAVGAVMVVISVMLFISGSNRHRARRDDYNDEVLKLLDRQIKVSDTTIKQNTEAMTAIKEVLEKSLSGEEAWRKDVSTMVERTEDRLKDTIQEIIGGACNSHVAEVRNLANEVRTLAAEVHDLRGQGEPTIGSINEHIVHLASLIAKLEKE